MGEFQDEEIPRARRRPSLGGPPRLPRGPPSHRCLQLDKGEWQWVRKN